MVKNIKLYTLGILVFLHLLSLSGVEGLIGALCYPLAFILPTVGLLLITKKDGLPSFLLICKILQHFIKNIAFLKKL